MIRGGLWWAGALIVAALASGVVGGGAAARNTVADVGWGGFGNTPDENRHSPLTQVDVGNVSKLGRLFTVDFRQIDPTVRRGEQSYPVEANGTLYVTTNDDNVWALDATTGKVKWRWTPGDVAVFRNFGIVANRGVALCDGHVFVLTLDMTIVSLNPTTGQLQRQVPIAKAVPGASSNYGYSETSAPICADHRVIVGAAGSEYGVRGFVMAYHTDLTPAWPNPFWTIPPAGTSWRKYGTLVGGGVVWTPTTVDPTTNTLYFGTGSATPLYFPQIRPGSNPRADSLIAVNLATGRMKWWQQQMAHNEWSYDTAQPPLVYTGKVGGKKERIVSVATMEGVWFAYDAASGRPIYQRIKVIDRTEHPALQPGKPVAVFPGSIGGLNYSPASYDPHTNYVFNAAAETAALDTQAVLTPTEKKRKFNLGDVFLGLANGNFGTLLPGWHDHGSVSAIDVNTGKRVWKFNTPEPERGGVTTTDSGIGFSGDGDGVLRAFDLKTGKILWTFQTGAQIASGASLYSVGGKEYVAITVGGTPTSSGGGTASQLQVFGLGGSQQQSPGAAAARVRQRQDSTRAAAAGGAGDRARAGRPRRAEAPGRPGRLRHHRDSWRACCPALARELLERQARTRPHPAERRAGRGRKGRRGRLRRAAGDCGKRHLPLRRRHHACGAARRARERSRACHRPRARAERGSAECAHGSVRRLQRRLRVPRPDRAPAEGRQRRRHGSGHRHCRGRAARRSSAHLPAQWDDHGRVGQAGSGRRGDYAHPGP